MVGSKPYISYSFLPHVLYPLQFTPLENRPLTHHLVNLNPANPSPFTIDQIESIVIVTRRNLTELDNFLFVDLQRDARGSVDAFKIYNRDVWARRHYHTYRRVAQGYGKSVDYSFQAPDEDWQAEL